MLSSLCRQKKKNKNQPIPLPPAPRRVHTCNSSGFVQMCRRSPIPHCIRVLLLPPAGIYTYLKPDSFTKGIDVYAHRATTKRRPSSRPNSRRYYIYIMKYIRYTIRIGTRIIYLTPRRRRWPLKSRHDGSFFSSSSSPSRRTSAYMITGVRVLHNIHYKPTSYYIVYNIYIHRIFFFFFTSTHTAMSVISINRIIYIFTIHSYTAAGIYSSTR